MEQHRCTFIDQPAMQRGLFIASVIILIAMGLTALQVARTTGDTSAPGAYNTHQALPIKQVGDHLPLRFEQNKGQIDTTYDFLSRPAGYAVFLKAGGIEIRSNPSSSVGLNGEQITPQPSASMIMHIAGANSDAIPTPLHPLVTKSNYFPGPDPSQWTTGIPNFGKVRYKEVYPGIDVVYYGRQGRLEFDFVVSPRADPRKISMQFEGHKHLSIDADGKLILQTEAGPITYEAPVLYQPAGTGGRNPIAGRYVRRDANRIGFDIASYDASLPLIIDPVVVYSTYLGSPEFDKLADLAVDAAGNAFVTGESDRMYVKKINAEGTAVLFETFFGGSVTFSEPRGIAISAAGTPIVVGDTRPEDFPIVAPIQEFFGGGTTDAFILELNDAGEIVFSTFYGGDGSDRLDGIHRDEAGNLYMYGAASGNFPTTEGAFQPAGLSNGFFHGLVLKTNADFQVQFATFLRSTTGNSSSDIRGLAVDANGNVYVGGRIAPLFPEQPNDLPVTAGALKTESSTIDGYVAGLNPTGTSLLYATYLGGETPAIENVGADDFVQSIGVDAEGNVYATGQLTSADFPFQNPIVQGSNGGFVAKLNTSGSGLAYSTFLDGIGFDIVVDPDGSAYVGGSTASAAFPVVDALQDALLGSSDGFLTVLDPEGTAYQFSTYFGGDAGETVFHLARDAQQNVYLAGTTNSTQFPLTAPLQETYAGGGTDGFLAKIAFAAADAALNVTPNPVLFPFTAPGDQSTKTVTITSTGNAPLEIINIDVEPTDRFDLPDDPDTPFTLDPGETFEFDVAYQPGVPGKTATGFGEEGTLTIVNNSATPILPVSLQTVDIVVNQTSDEDDPDLTDDLCDVDLGITGNQCTLRAAIQTVTARTSDQPVSIAFAIPDSDAPTIRIASLLPFLETPVNLDASTQPGDACVTLDGSDMDTGSFGLRLFTSRSIIRGLCIQHFTVGILTAGAGESQIEDVTIRYNGNGISISASEGLQVLDSRIYGNSERGIYIFETAGVVIENNDIGIPEEGQEDEDQKIGIQINENSQGNTLKNNIFSRHTQSGVYINGSAGNVVIDNAIGTNRIGDPGLGNEDHGILLVNQAERNLIKDNTIAGNGRSGISITSGIGNRIERNKIGTDQLGIFALLGNEEDGVAIYHSKSDSLLNNVIVNNGRHGVYVHSDAENTEAIYVKGNKIGVNDQGIGRMANEGHGIVIEGENTNKTQIEANTISGNRMSGIFLGENAFDSLILGNKIGTDESGTSSVENEEHGIEVENASLSFISENTISGNRKNGVYSTNRAGRLRLTFNHIGIDADGLRGLGNGENGIRSEGHPIQLYNNIISANTLNGVLFTEQEFPGIGIVDGNKIGTDRLGRDILGDLGNRLHGILVQGGPRSVGGRIVDNTIAFNLETGIQLEHTEKMQLLRNRIRRNVTGVRAINSNVTRLLCNDITGNIERNVDLENTEGDFVCNTIAEAEGSNTGIHLTDAHALIRGNQLYGDAGDAITLEGASTAEITNNNIFENLGFGVNNLTPAVMVQAASNWWGDAAGPGAGDVSEGVDFSNWRRSPFSVVAAAEQDTLILPVGESDTVSVFLQNWTDRVDQLDITVLETQRWLSSAAAYTVDLTDSLGASTDVVFSIPAGASDGTENFIELTATSRTDDFNSDRAQFYVVAQQAALAGLSISPDSVLLIPGDTVAFRATGFDQFGRPTETPVLWNAAGGTIDSDGVYVAGSETGVFSVTASDPTGLIQDQAVVSLVLTRTHAEGEASVPVTFTLYQNYPNPFSESTTFLYDLPKDAPVQLDVYDTLGRRVRSLVRSQQSAGRYRVIWTGASDAGAPVASGVYFYQLRAENVLQTRRLVVIR